jgi:hypothetical protein
MRDIGRGGLSRRMDQALGLKQIFGVREALLVPVLAPVQDEAAGEVLAQLMADLEQLGEPCTLMDARTVRHVDDLAYRLGLQAESAADAGRTGEFGAPLSGLSLVFAVMADAKIADILAPDSDCLVLVDTHPARLTQTYAAAKGLMQVRPDVRQQLLAYGGSLNMAARGGARVGSLLTQVAPATHRASSGRSALLGCHAPREGLVQQVAERLLALSFAVLPQPALAPTSGALH